VEIVANKGDSVVLFTRPQSRCNLPVAGLENRRFVRRPGVAAVLNILDRSLVVIAPMIASLVNSRQIGAPLALWRSNADCIAPDP
jgi:hypothetical protein